MLEGVSLANSLKTEGKKSNFQGFLESIFDFMFLFLLTPNQMKFWLHSTWFDTYTLNTPMPLLMTSLPTLRSTKVKLSDLDEPWSQFLMFTHAWNHFLVYGVRKKEKKTSNFKALSIFWVDSPDFYSRSESVRELPEVEMYEGKDLQKQPFI